MKVADTLLNSFKTEISSFNFVGFKEWDLCIDLDRDAPIPYYRISVICTNGLQTH